YGVAIDETDFSNVATVRELEERVGSVSAAPAPAPERGRPAGPSRLLEPRWSRWRLFGLTRRVLHAAVVRPLLRVWVRIETSGAGALDRVHPPVLFASTHGSHL